MLAAVVGALLIISALVAAVLIMFAAGMADREVNTFREVVVPCLWCLVPLALGVALIVLR